MALKAEQPVERLCRRVVMLNLKFQSDNFKVKTQPFQPCKDLRSQTQPTCFCP